MRRRAMRFGFSSTLRYLLWASTRAVSTCKSHGRHPGGANRSRRPGDLSRSRSARGLPAASTSAPCARCARAGRGARERRDRLRQRSWAWRRAGRGRRRGCTSTARNSRASVCAFAAVRATTAWHSMCRWILSPSSESTCAATRDLAVTRLADLAGADVHATSARTAAAPWASRRICTAAIWAFVHNAISTDLQAVSSR